MMNDIGKTQTLDELADKLAIIEIIHAYARGVDRADSGILKSTCWEDAEVDYGGYKGLAHPFCESLPNAIKNYKNTFFRVIINSLCLRTANLNYIHLFGNR